MAQRLLLIYCPKHAGVSGNERANRLASTANITSGLQIGRTEVLRSLRNFLNMGRPQHDSIDCLKERGVEKGSGPHSALRCRKRSVRKYWHCFESNLWATLKDGGGGWGVVLSFPRATIYPVRCVLDLEQFALKLELFNSEL